MINEHLDSYVLKHCLFSVCRGHKVSQEKYTLIESLKRIFSCAREYFGSSNIYKIILYLYNYIYKIILYLYNYIYEIVLYYIYTIFIFIHLYYIGSLENVLPS